MGSRLEYYRWIIRVLGDNRICQSSESGSNQRIAAQSNHVQGGRYGNALAFSYSDAPSNSSIASRSAASIGFPPATSTAAQTPQKISLYIFQAAFSVCSCAGFGACRYAPVHSASSIQCSQILWVILDDVPQCSSDKKETKFSSGTAIVLGCANGHRGG